MLLDQLVSSNVSFLGKCHQVLKCTIECKLVRDKFCTSMRNVFSFMHSEHNFCCCQILSAKYLWCERKIKQFQTGKMCKQDKKPCFAVDSTKHVSIQSTDTSSRLSKYSVTKILKDHPHERPHFFENHFTESYRFIKKKKKFYFHFYYSITSSNNT